MRCLLKFSYDGSEFYGYQKQPGKRTVEGILEGALYKINNYTDTRIYSSGRTDRGVHAFLQTGHCDINVEITPYKLKRALNSLISDDIHVISAEFVDDDFNSRFNVTQKTYVYKINIGEYSPVDRKYIYQYNKKLDIDKMKYAIKDFVGEKDFKPFVSEEAKKNNYIRTINKTKILLKNDIMEIFFTGNGFMKYQVRNMVGTLIKIGAGKLEKTAIRDILLGNLEKKYVFTAPSQGLYLKNVIY